MFVEADGYDPSVAVEHVTLNTQGASVMSLYRLEHALSVMKAQAYRFEIEDAEPKESGESFSISGLALEVGLLPGVQRGRVARAF